MSLDFGLLYDLVVPKPWGPRTEYDYVQSTIGQMVNADRLGFTHCWMVEHHFLPEYSHSTAPDAMLGAVAAQTENIRVGFGVKLMPFNFNHPLRNAEMTATMDLVSNGRLEVGTGRSGSRNEIEGFGIDPEKTREQWEEATRMMVEAWTADEFTWDSPSFQIPPRVVVPKPLQKPHPPLWMATTGPDSHEVAGEFGFGCLSFTVMVPVEELERRVGLYETAFKKAKPIGKFSNHNIGTYCQVHVAETTEKAREQAAPCIDKFVKFVLNLVGEFKAWVDTRGTEIPTLNYLNALSEFDPDSVTFDWLDSNDICIVGDPDTVINKVKRYQDIGITQLIGAHDLWGLPLADIEKSIELFGKHVIPEFRD